MHRLDLRNGILDFDEEALNVFTKQKIRSSVKVHARDVMKEATLFGTRNISFSNDGLAIEPVYERFRASSCFACSQSERCVPLPPR